MRTIGRLGREQQEPGVAVEQKRTAADCGEAVVRRAEAAYDLYGFRDFKLKGGVLPDTDDIPGAGEAEDSVGTTVAVGDINKDGKPELFISAAEENNAARSGSFRAAPAAPPPRAAA
ncbi:hypothetical protein [Streptomyces sp. NPDC096152]|uniref:FG-GAP repeat protein n=1 Tax=Streptomyces sp. NPDC096152 TaxID=3366078 RepID=UPI0038115877